MKLSKYFRQLKRFSVSRKQFKVKGIKNSYYYSYNRKIFFNFLLFGLFKNEIPITFGSNYWSHVPTYIFSSLPKYVESFIYYKWNKFYCNKIKNLSTQFLVPSKPLSPKDLETHISVWESVLENVAHRNGFDIVDENLTSLKSVYILVLL
jgi:hypothetical protein